mmetsp:Transcript_76562/g.211495  ORF Transcript_76562/g.211495 Transcript_76562/m.211495 type:complete len:227 (+) Transcript_76562:221-901(+)
MLRELRLTGQCWPCDPPRHHWQAAGGGGCGVVAACGRYPSGRAAKGVAAPLEAPLAASEGQGDVQTHVKSEALLADVEGGWMQHGLLATLAGPDMPGASGIFLTQVAMDRFSCRELCDDGLLARGPDRGLPTGIHGLQDAQNPHPAAHALQLSTAHARRQPCLPALRRLRLPAGTCPHRQQSVATAAFGTSCHGGAVITEHLDLRRLRFPVEAGPPIAGGRAICVR